MQYDAQVLGWIATFILLVGYYLNAKKQTSSWVVWFIGNTLMLIYSAIIEAYAVSFLSLFLMILNVYGYISWKKK